MLSLLLHTAPAAASSDPPPWWFFVSIVLVILAAALFMMRLALSSGRKRKSRRPCPSCGVPVQPAWVRCPACGDALGPAAGAGPSGANGGLAATAPHVGPATIEFKSGPLAGRSYPLERDVTTIGSVEGNTVVLQDTGVSRKHVGIRKVAGGFELADLGSTNGVFVNGEKSARRRLVLGDVIRVGTSEAVFKG